MNEQPKDDSKALTCLRCGGEMFVCQTNSDTYLQPLNAGPFEGQHSGLIVYVCNNCGYTELYAKDIPLLRHEHEE